MAYPIPGPTPGPIPGVRGLPTNDSSPMSIRDLGEMNGAMNFGPGAKVSQFMGGLPPTLPQGAGGPTVAGASPGGVTAGKQALYQARANMGEQLRLIEEILKIQKKLGIAKPELAAKFMQNPADIADISNVENAKKKADNDREMKQQGVNNKSTPQLAASGIEGPPVDPGRRASVPPMGRMGGPQTQFGKSALPRGLA